MTDQPADKPIDVDDETYQQQAADAVGSIQAGSAADATESIEAMASRLADQRLQAAMSDYETQMAQILKQSQDQAAQFGAQIAVMQRQLSTVRAQAGPPDSMNLATAIRTRLASIAAANPDRGPGHWSAVVDQGNRLYEAVKAAVAAEDPHDEVTEAGTLAGGIAKFLTKTTRQVSARPVEGADVILDEIERLGESFAELQPAA